MRKVIFILLAISCTPNSTSLEKKCPIECFSHPDPLKYINKFSSLPLEAQKNLGLCNSGVPLCDENGNIILCNEAVLPSGEICDGLDNDCDGIVDEDTSGYPLRLEGRNNGCHYPGVCAGSNKICVNSKWECSYPQTYEPIESSCDGLDNDCDGLIDESLETNQLCYTSDILTASNPPCHPGVMKCLWGEYVCRGQSLPRLETCDNIDNDCNGVIDDTERALQTKHDIVFLVDTSGSMCSLMHIIITSLHQFTSQYRNNNNYKFALVNINPMNSNQATIVNFLNIQDLVYGFNTINCSGTGAEPSIDALNLACNLNSNFYNLNWRELSKKVVVLITDEEPQSFTSPLTSLTEASQQCLFTQMSIFIWGPQEFDRIFNFTSGERFDIPPSVEVMTSDLNTIISSFCE